MSLIFSPTKYPKLSSPPPINFKSGLSLISLAIHLNPVKQFLNFFSQKNKKADGAPRTIDLQCQSLSLRRAFCFAACVCHVCLLRFLACSLTSNKDDRPAKSVAISPSSFFASQRVSVTAPDRRELCRLLANSLAKAIENHRENRLKIDPKIGLISKMRKPETAYKTNIIAMKNEVSGIGKSNKHPSQIDQKMKPKIQCILASIFARFCWVWGAKLEATWP